MRSWRAGLLGLCVPLLMWSCDDEDSVRQTDGQDPQDGGGQIDGGAVEDSSGETGDGAADADGSPESGVDADADPADADAGDADIDDASDADVDDASDADVDDAGDADVDDASDAEIADAGDADVDDAGDGEAAAPCCIDLLDWDGAQYSATSQVATLQLACGATIAFSIADPGTALTPASPAVGTTLNGPSTSNGTLGIGVQDLVTGTSVLFAFDFAGLPGGQALALSFPLFDVDRGVSSAIYEEQVEVRGFLGGLPVTPVLSFDSGFVQALNATTVQGTNTADPDTDEGTVNVAFASPVDRLEVEFRNGTGAGFDPGPHGIAIGDLSFTPLCQ